MNENLQIISEIEKAVEFCEKQYTRTELFDVLKINSQENPQTDIEKQMCILKITDIKTQAEADLLIYHLTGHHGLIREATAQKVNEFLKTDFAHFFQTQNIADSLLKAVYDINPNICRMIIEVLPNITEKEYFIKNLYTCLNETIEQLEKLKRSNWYTKKLFNLYWGLEALNSLTPQIDTQLNNLVAYCVQIKEYTIREKLAQLLSNLEQTSDEIENAKAILKQDPNYYVKRFAQNWSL